MSLPGAYVHNLKMTLSNHMLNIMLLVVVMVVVHLRGVGGHVPELKQQYIKYFHVIYRVVFSYYFSSGGIWYTCANH